MRTKIKETRRKTKMLRKRRLTKRRQITRRTTTRLRTKIVDLSHLHQQINR